MRFFNVVFIEGVRRIGRSSQCVQLRLKMGSEKRQVAQLNLDQPLNPKELNAKVDEIRQWCRENPQGTLVVNGSLAYSIIYKDVQNQKYGSSYPEYEIPIKNFLNLLRELKVLSLLMKSNDYSFLEKRFSAEETYNLVEIKMVYDGLEFFEQSQISNFKWTPVEVSQYDTILKIHDKILKALE